MKQIPKKKIFSKQHFGAPELSDAYFLYAGIFLHFWGVLEWVISKELYDQREKITKHPDAQEKLVKKLNKCRSFEDVFLNKSHWIMTSEKLNLLKLINPTVCTLVDQPKKLRDTIAHNHINYPINMGVYQSQPGWVKKQIDEEATNEYKEQLKKAQKSNPDISDEEIESLVLQAIYSETDVRNEIYTLIEAIKQVGYNVETDNIYKMLKKKDIL